MADFQAVLWDFGGVFSSSPFSTIEEIGREKGHDPSEFFDAIFGPYHGDTDHPWHRLERGEVDFASARDSIIALGLERGMEVDPIELFTRMGQSGGGMRQDVIELATRVKARGYQTAIVTNNAREFRERWVSSVPIDDICHAIVDSSEVGVRKPEARIYQIALERLGVLDPSRVIFVDDYPANVEAARALGMRGVLMPDEYGAAVAEIEDLVFR